MDTSLKDDIKIEEGNVTSEEIRDNEQYNHIDVQKEAIADENKDIKRTSFTSSTWGTLLIMLILTVTSVCIYEPLKNYILPSFAGIPAFDRL